MRPTRIFVAVAFASIAVASTPAAQTPAFEVASIRYEILDAQLVGGPRWIESDRFDINASRGGAPFGQVPAMMRTLLTDRFNLKVHREMRDMPMYTLVQAKSNGTPGPAMKPANCDDRGDVTGFPGATDRVLPCHVHFVGPGRLRAGGIHMRGLAGILTPMVGRIVIDKTSLTGPYDFELSWMPDRPRPMPDGAPAPDPAGASLFTALQEQLGLKLTGGRGPIEVLVIDSVAAPTDN